MTSGPGKLAPQRARELPASSNTRQTSPDKSLSLRSRCISEGMHQSFPNHAACPENSTAWCQTELHAFEAALLSVWSRKQAGGCRRCFSSRSLLPPEPGHELPFNLPPRSPHSAGFVQGPLIMLLLGTPRTEVKLLHKKILGGFMKPSTFFGKIKCS